MNIRFCGQCMAQLAGLIYANIRYSRSDIGAENYVPSIRYSLPFEGKWYVVNGGVTEVTSHSWNILPQRFAYDFYMVNSGGVSYEVNQKDLSSYYCYGKSILAPADGIVVAIKNKFPDCRIMGSGQTDPDSPDIAGNRIIIKHAEHEYSALCHLMPGSITVRKGQQVKRGQVIAKCGNSGNTTEPHLHFQLQNTAAFYSSHGLPIHFQDFKAKPFENYAKIDPRSFPGDGDQIEGCLSRGLLVNTVVN